MPSLRQPSGLGFALRDPYPWDELAGLARAGEELGYAALFMPEVGSRDTLAALTGLAGETASLWLGTGVIPLPSRTTGLLAMAAATAAERSGGRLVLGLGTGPAVPGALERLRATVLALRAGFEGDADVPDADGEPFALQLRPPFVPIWIAALGPRAVRLAGEVADGVLLNWCTPERVATARAGVAAAAVAAGRDPGDIAIGVYVRAGDPSAAAALRAAAADYASYPAYARQFELMGVDPSDTDAVVAAVSLPQGEAGRQRLAAYGEAGADLAVVYPVVTPGPRAAAQARAVLEAFAP